MSLIDRTSVPSIASAFFIASSVANSMALFMMTLRYSSPIAGNGTVVALHEEEIGDLASIFEHIAEGRFLVAVGNALHESRG